MRLGWPFGTWVMLLCIISARDTHRFYFCGQLHRFYSRAYLYAFYDYAALIYYILQAHLLTLCELFDLLVTVPYL